jgi:hypothetical protein
MVGGGAGMADQCKLDPVAIQTLQPGQAQPRAGQALGQRRRQEPGEAERRHRPRDLGMAGGLERDVQFDPARAGLVEKANSRQIQDTHIFEINYLDSMRQKRIFSRIWKRPYIPCHPARFHRPFPAHFGSLRDKGSRCNAEFSPQKDGCPEFH